MRGECGWSIAGWQKPPPAQRGDSFGRMEYEIRDGKVVYKDEGPIGVLVTERHVGATAEPTLARMAASSQGRRGSLVSQIKGAPTEADTLDWPNLHPIHGIAFIAFP